MTEDRVLYLSTVLNAEILPATEIKLTKAPDTTINVPTVLRQEKRWYGAIPSQFNSVPNKIPLEFESSATWAEIILVRLLEGDGWSAAWFKNWGGRAFWRDVKQVATLPKYATDKFKQVYAASGGRGGCWDIFACRDGEFLFVESKHRGRDRIRTSQARWLETALDAGIPASSFAIVEWRIS